MSELRKRKRTTPAAIKKGSWASRALFLATVVTFGLLFSCYFKVGCLGKLPHEDALPGGHCALATRVGARGPRVLRAGRWIAESEWSRAFTVANVAIFNLALCSLGSPGTTEDGVQS